MTNELPETFDSPGPLDCGGTVTFAVTSIGGPDGVVGLGIAQGVAEHRPSCGMWHLAEQIFLDEPGYLGEMNPSTQEVYAALEAYHQGMSVATLVTAIEQITGSTPMLARDLN